VVGLIGAATFSEPQAFWLNGVWRPAGTLEYAPALVLLEVCALAALLGALSSGARLAWLAAAPVAAAGAVLGLSNSRLGLAMALVVLAGGVVAAQPARRGRALRGVALVVLAALAARVGLGGIGPAGAGSETWRVAVVIGICVQAPLAWWVMGAAARRSQRVGRVGAVGLVAAVGLSIALAIALAPSGAGRSARPEHPQAVRSVHRDVLHGRGQIWAAGVRAFVRRPLQGHGAGSFLAATADLQRPVITSYAHDLPLELGVELGVAGALLGLALYVLTARAWWRARGVAGAPLLAVPALAFLAANLVDWPWHVGGIGAVWAAATGALIAAGAGDRSRRSDTVAPVHGPPGRQRKVQMTSVRKVVSTLLISGACVTGLAACGGSDTVSDSSFLDRCKKTIDTNAALKAYSADTCNCVQKKLEAQGFGKKSPDDKAISPQTAAATRDCLKQVAG
jgi:O-antigen ligase